MNTLIDIFNNHLKYDKYNITVIIDNKNMPWFSGSDVAKILGYEDTDRTIRQHVPREYTSKFSELKQFIHIIPSNAQPTTIYINESGLYSLLFSSQKDYAKQFRHWVLSEVLPSIRKTGSYHIEEKYQQQLKEINNKLKSYKKEIKILKNNQKGHKYKVTGIVYIIRPVNSTNTNINKLGHSSNFNDRLNTYNTSVPDNMKTVFTLEVENPKAVEMCTKSLLSKYIYRNNKEYYDCPVKKMKQIIRRCSKLVNDHSYCETCNSTVSFDKDHSYCHSCNREIHIDHFINDESSNSDSVSNNDSEISQNGGIKENIDVPFITIPDEIKSNPPNPPIQSNQHNHRLSDERVQQLGGRKVHNENSTFSDQIDIYYKTSNVIKCKKFNIKNKLFYLGSVPVESRLDVFNSCITHSFEQQRAPDGRILFKCSVKNLIFICKCYEKSIRTLINEFMLTDDDIIILDSSCILI